MKSSKIGIPSIRQERGVEKLKKLKKYFLCIKI